MRDVKRILIVDDDPLILDTIKDVLEAWDVEVYTASTEQEAISLLATPMDVVLTDVRLGEGDGLAVARAAMMLRPSPVVVAMTGVASAEEGVRLGHAGVMACIQKPVSLDELRRVLKAALEAPPSFLPLVSAQVGSVPLSKALGEVRGTMLRQALGLVGGNRSGAARLLGITRQAVQQMLKAQEQAVAPSASTEGADGQRAVGQGLGQNISSTNSMGKQPEQYC